jgi:hypothetical protein
MLLILAKIMVVFGGLVAALLCVGTIAAIKIAAVRDAEWEHRNRKE